MFRGKNLEWLSLFLAIAACLTCGGSGLSDQRARKAVEALLSKGQELPDNYGVPAQLVEWRGLVQTGNTEIQAKAVIRHRNGTMTGAFVFHRMTEGGWVLDRVSFQTANGHGWWSQEVFQRVDLSEPTTAATANLPLPASPPRQGVKITDITLGKSLAAGKTVADQTESFQPADTIYVSIRTEGAASRAQLAVRWTYEGGQAVDDSNQFIAPNGPEVTEFHVSKPDGWPAGGYKVEVLLNGASSGIKEFRVR